MKDFFKVFLLIAGALLFYLGLALLTNVNPFLLSIIGIVLSVVIIGGGILLFRNKHSHKLPKEKRKQHLEEYKKQFKEECC